MICVSIPDFGDLELHHLVSDYNGTLALDGVLLDGVAERLARLANVITVHVITADTFGLAAQQLANLPVQLTITAPDDQASAKLRHVEALGAEHVVALGNGRNDRLMLAAASLGIALVQKEGGSAETVRNADVLSTSVLDALDLLINPNRLKATLRS